MFFFGGDSRIPTSDLCPALFLVEHPAREAAVWEYCKGFRRFCKVAGTKPLGRVRFVSSRPPSRDPDRNFGTFGTRLKGLFRVPIYENETNEAPLKASVSCLILKKWDTLGQSLRVAYPVPNLDIIYYLWHNKFLSFIHLYRRLKMIYFFHATHN